MIFEISSRGFGKTTRFVEFVKMQDANLLVYSERERDRIIEKHGLERLRVHTLQDLESLRWRGKVKRDSFAPLYIDSLDDVLNNWFALYGLRVDGFSMRGE